MSSALPTIFQGLATSPAKSAVGARRGHAPHLGWRCCAAFSFERHLTRTQFFTFCEALGRPASPALTSLTPRSGHADLIPIAAALRPYLAEAMLSARGARAAREGIKGKKR